MIKLKMPIQAKEYHLLAMSKSTRYKISLKKKIENKFQNYLSNQVTIVVEDKKIKRVKRVKLNLRQIRIVRLIYIFILNNFEKLVIGDVKDLKTLNEQFEKLKAKYFVDKNFSSELVKECILNEIYTLFRSEYDNFSDGFLVEIGPKKYKNWGAYEYVKLLNNLVCPYCNAQFILTIDQHDNPDRKGKTRPDLDHFLSKMQHSIFSISLYNLVPCCKICNSSFKHEQNTDFDNFYSPFDEEIDGKFRFVREFYTKKRSSSSRSLNYTDAILGSTSKFKIKIIPGVEKNHIDYKVIEERVKKNVEMFRLEDVYRYHKPYVQEMIIKERIYTEAYKQQLLKNFPKIFRDKSELESFFIVSDDNVKSKILSKMSNDIIKYELMQHDIEIIE